MSGLIGIDVGSIITGVGKVADDLFTSDEERLNAELKRAEIDQRTDLGQMDVNKAEAAHASVFVAGWRPAIGWIGAAALAYQFILYPLLVWGWAFLQAKGYVPGDMKPPPVLDAEALWVLLTGMLGIAGMRSFDKFKGIETGRVTR